MSSSNWWTFSFELSLVHLKIKTKNRILKFGGIHNLFYIHLKDDDAVMKKSIITWKTQCYEPSVFCNPFSWLAQQHEQHLPKRRATRMMTSPRQNSGNLNDVWLKSIKTVVVISSRSCIKTKTGRIMWRVGLKRREWCAINQDAHAPRSGQQNFCDSTIIWCKLSPWKRRENTKTLSQKTSTTTKSTKMFLMWVRLLC